jgi:ribonucleotide monophosphatase NagD (HAD superfamily)
MDPSIQAVLIALDQNFNYTKLCLASLYVQTGKAKLVCTNEDNYIPIAGRKYPGTGSIVESV